MTDKIIRVKIEAGDSQQQIAQLDKAMTSAGASADQLNDELLGLSQGLGTKLTPTAKAVQVALNESTDGMNKFSRSAGQAGVQIEQFVGQVSAGTNPLTAFSQQAADIGIVLGAPLLGAIIGISAAIASVLVPSLIGGKTETEKLNDALDDLREVSGVTEDGIYLLNQEIINLAESSEAAAKVKLAANILEAKDAAIQASKAFDDAFDVGRLQFAVDTYSSGVGALAGVSNEVVGISRRIGEQFGLQGNAAIKFGADVSKAIGDIQKAPTTGNFDAFINLVSGQAAATGTKQTTALAGSLLELASKGRQAAQEAGNAQQAIDNLGAALENSKEKTDNNNSALETFNRRLQLQNIALKDGELQANLQAAAWANGKESVDQLDAATKALVTENYRLTESQKASKEALSETNAELSKQATLDADVARRAEKERQRINERIANMRLETQTMAAESELQRAVKNEQFTQEEADLAAQTASRLLAASTEFSLLMENKAITDAQKIEAERLFREQILAINQQYDASEEELAIRKQMAINSTNQQIRDANLSSMSAGVSLLETFLGKSNAIVKAARVAMGAYQAFSIYASSQAASWAALQPAPIGLGPIAGVGLSAALATAGKVSAAAVLASSVAGAIGGGGGGGSIGGYSSNSSNSSSALPTTPQAAATVNTLEIVGLAELKDELRNNEGMVSTRFVASILDKIEDANRLRGQA